MRRRTSKKVYQCVRQTSKNTQIVLPPPYPAHECPNKKMKGDNGKMYISLDSEFGVSYRWYPYSKELMKRRNGK